MIKVVMFDLDGTLLPMDQDAFVKACFGGLAKKLLPFGYEPTTVVEAFRHGVGAMIKNDGKKNKQNSFLECFSKAFG